MSRRKLLRRLLPKTPWGDYVYGRYAFIRRFGRYPENPPVRFNDHLFALKTSGMAYDPIVQFVTDKEYAKLYISAVLGAEYVIETHRILRSKEELKNYRPDRIPCVLKPTHASGLVMICTDPVASLDIKKLEEWFDSCYYENTREQNYRHLVPKIIVEDFFSEDGQTIPKDYKFFCFHGIPEFIQVDSDRFSSHTRNLYDTSWTRIPATYVYPGRKRDDAKPALLNDMLQAAATLSASFPFVRVDMYATEHEMRVGELTFFPECASGLLKPVGMEFKLGVYFGNAGRR